MLTRLSSLALAAAALASAASAQCFLPDNLSGPCCAPAQALLPDFPKISLPGEGFCWEGCQPKKPTCTKVVLGAPEQVACAQYEVALDVVDCTTGQGLLKSTLHLDYTRTWNEIAAGGPGYQVWRFVVKADVSAASTDLTACPIPACLGTHPTAYFHGYVDYAFRCEVGTWEAALVLFHGCDKLQHDPLISDRPGVFHPGTSYALVAPTTAANPFVPALLPGPGGPLFEEALRRAPSPVTLACSTEEPVLQGVIAPLGQACVCPFSFQPPQVTARHAEAAAACGSSFRTVSAFPALPWLELLTTSLGTWTTGANYPGPEAVWVDEGTFLHFEACGAAGVVPFAEIKYGASTQFGYPAVLPSGVMTDRFTDLADNYSSPLGQPLLGPFVGSVKPTRHLIYVNPD